MKLQPGRTRGKNSIFTRATRFIWVRLPWHQITVNVPWNKDGTLQHVLLALTRGTNQAVTIDLTNLTLPELVAFREAILIATEVAEPIVRDLDAKAQERLHNGDDSDDRVYRGLPQVVVRQGALGQYDKGVLQRREDVFRGVGATVLPGELPPFLGGTVDQLEEEESGSENDPSSNGKPEAV